MNQHKLIKYLGIAVLACLFFSCSKMDDTYSEFLEKGETVYIGKADSVKTYGGNGRLRLSWLFIGDPKITKYVVYWDNRADSIVKTIQRGTGIDSINVVIEPLAEGVHNFEIFSFDDLGHTSLKVEVPGIVYGQKFQSSIFNRILKKATLQSGEDYARLEWGSSDTTEVGVEVAYTLANGEAKTVLIPKTQTSSQLPGYKRGTAIRYRTLHIPKRKALDTFTTGFDTLASAFFLYQESELEVLDKANFRETPFPMDISSAWGWTMPLLWDNVLAEGSGFHTPDAPFPHRFTFDLGVTTELNKMKTWQRQANPYTEGNPRKFEIWGSNDPSIDGSYTGWVKLLDCESIKPSGQAVGVTGEDVVYATQTGETFLFPADSPPVRYIRFNILQSWRGISPGSSHLMEVSFWKVK
ncbi:MAG: DUF4998 domain-containing protein [Sphingobacteriaceae bacterium]